MARVDEGTGNSGGSEVVKTQWFEIPTIRNRMHRGDDHDDILLVECPNCDREVYFDHRGRTQVCSVCGNILMGLEHLTLTVADAIERDARAHHG